MVARPGACLNRLYRSSIGSRCLLGVKERVKRDASIFLELRADLLADFHSQRLAIGEIKVLHHALRELIRGGERLMEVP